MGQYRRRWINNFIYVSILIGLVFLGFGIYFLYLGYIGMIEAESMRGLPYGLTEMSYEWAYMNILIGIICLIICAVAFIVAYFLNKSLD